MIEALTTIKIQQLEQNRADAQARRKELIEEVDAELISFARKNVRKLDAHACIGSQKREWNEELGQYETRNEPDHVYVQVHITAVPGRTAQKLLEIYQIPEVYRVPDRKQIKQEITRSLNGYTDPSERVELLLTNPQSRSALEAMLMALEL